MKVMKMIKKATALFLTVGMIASLAACGGASSAPAGGNDQAADSKPADAQTVDAQAADAGTTAAVSDAGSTAAESAASFDKIVFGTNAEFAPFEYVNPAGGVIGEFDGIDMAIAKQIGEDLGAEVSINNIEFDSLLIALPNGQIDAIIAGMTITDERKETVDFTIPYYNATQVMIIKEGTEIAKAEDMKGKNIAVIQGYTGETVVKKLGYDYVSFKKGPDAIMDLVNGKSDVVVIDSATAQRYVNDNNTNNPDKKLVIVEDNEKFDKEEYGIAVKKGNTELLNALNAEIEKMLADGTIDNLADKYAVAAEE